MSRYKRDRRVRPEYFPGRISRATVKVENLPKTAVKSDLWGRLEEHSCEIESIHVKDCPTSPVDYAYINCTNMATAEAIVKEVNNKMLLQSNLLTAKIKGEQGSQQQHGTLQSTGSSSSSNAGSSKDICAVKVLIHDDSISGAELDRYFSRYGELRVDTIVRRGTPDYAYVNFKDPMAAQKVRNESSHQIQAAKVIATPYRTSNPQTPAYPAACQMPAPVYPPAFHVPGRAPHLVSKQSPFTSIITRCDPLAVKYVREDVLRHFPSSQVNFSVKNGDEVTVCAQVDIAESVETYVRRSINSHESELSRLELLLESYYLPILADYSTQQKFAEVQVPFEIKIRCTKGYVSLKELASTYSPCKEKAVDADCLKGFLSSVVSQKKVHVKHYQWYWKDDDQSFQPYDADVNAKLENAFQDGTSILERIGKFEYGINTSKMSQKNLTTGKKREIERRAVSPSLSEQQNVSLQLKAHSNHLQEIRRAIIETMDKAVIVKKFEIPCISVKFNVFNHFMKVAARAFVSAERSRDQDAIMLKGASDVVKDTEIRLKEEILNLRERLSKESRLSSNVSTPHYWEPQSKRCELKLVKKGSTEWREIAQRLTEPGFQVDIVKIERIQNKWLWEVFDNSRRRMDSKNMGQINEKQLFHGTRSIPPEKIYNSEQGFDNRLASSGMWGTGTYFAVKASYSASRYAYTTSEGHHQVFLAQVITGITCKCPSDSSLRLPPLKPKTKNSTEFVDERYDSVSGNTNNSEVFVIYEHGKVYPAYLITYTFSVSRLRL